MDNLNKIFAENVIALRNEKNMTQMEFGEKFNYSDKAVSRWERGEAIPDARVLVQMSEFFGITVDDLLKRPYTKEKKKLRDKELFGNRRSITLISFISVWTVALISYIVLYLCDVNVAKWLSFVYALPISMIVLIVFGSLWGKKKWNFISVSLLVWSIIACIYLTFLSLNWWIIFILGIPAQIMIYLAFKIKRR